MCVDKSAPSWANQRLSFEFESLTTSRQATRSPSTVFCRTGILANPTTFQEGRIIPPNYNSLNKPPLTNDFCQLAPIIKQLIPEPIPNIATFSPGWIDWFSSP